MTDDVLIGRPSYPSLADLDQGGYDKGRGFLWQASWFAIQNLLFGAWWCPGAARPKLLRLFGAKIGDNVFIRHRVRVLWPWKLTVGSNTLIGEDTWLLNLEPINIGSDVCLSQGAFLCTGSHDHSATGFPYDNGPIDIQDGVWIATQALVLRGVTVSTGSVVGARAVVSHDVPAGSKVRVNARH